MQNPQEARSENTAMCKRFPFFTLNFLSCRRGVDTEEEKSTASSTLRNGENFKCQVH